MANSIIMVWGPHVARVKIKNILNLRIGLFKTSSSYVELILLGTAYLLGPLFVRAPPLGWGVRGALVSALFSGLVFVIDLSTTYCWILLDDIAFLCP